MQSWAYYKKIRSGGGRLSAVLVFLIVLGCPVCLGLGAISLAYHPLDLGSYWVYQVTEGGDSYVQDIRVKMTAEPSYRVLVVDSGKRSTEYTISCRNETVYLHRIRAKFKFLPLSRCKNFQPPLPFLIIDGENEVWNWTWSGEARGPGPDLVTVSYEARVVQEPKFDTERPLIEVTSLAEDDHGKTYRYVACYAAGIGLVEINTEGYSKVLIDCGFTE